ncbi:MAG TPA: AMP-binding protein [Polyangiaceae bacterium]|nr:AMP-binding protein [Polyangiaceae bacterium]
MIDPIDHAKRHHAARVAVIDGPRRLSFAELHERAARLGAGLRRLGIREGDRVAVLASNGHRYVEAFLGIPAFGMVVVPLNTRLAEPELAAILKDAKPRVLLTDRDPGRLAFGVEHTIALTSEYEAILLETGGVPSPCRDEGAVAALFYTGGTTGKPKGVIATHRNLVANAFHKTVACSLSPEDRFLAIAAMFHVAGVAPLVGLVWLGATTVTLPSFEPEATLDAIEHHRITVIMPVPTMVAALVASQRRRPRDVSSLRMLGHAGSSIPNALIEAAHETFPDAELAQFYGATETASIVTCFRHEERAIGTPLLGSCGQAAAGVAVKIARQDGSECAPGEVGEILVRGPNVTVGYWNDPAATAAALDGGWYRSGDLGLMRDDGYVFVVDRKKDMIITGGENVYSIEVEDVLGRHPSVVEAAVFGVPDPTWGEAVQAVVVVGEDLLPVAAAVVEELRAHCRQFVAGYKVPKHIELQAAPLPKSGPGKVLKRALRERFIASEGTNPGRS